MAEISITTKLEELKVLFNQMKSKFTHTVSEDNLVN